MKIQHKSKRATPPLPQVAELINRLLNTPSDDLHEVLGQIQTWKWPRSDLNAWTGVLNKFDAYLEEIIRDYDIDNIQTNVFTPLTKKTVCELLRFERLLLENSTNRKTFNSYDRLNSLLSTSDLDVLVLALNLLLRPAQQYSAQSAVLHALSISTPRLTSLAKRWPNLREYDITIADLVTERGQAQVDALPEEAREVNFTFYRQEAPGSTAGKEKEKAVEVDVFDAPPQTPSRKVGGSTVVAAGPSSSGAVNVHINSKTIEAKEPMDVLADAIEANSIPPSEKFELLTRIRAARALTKTHAHERQKLVQVRLLATAIYGHTHSEAQAQASLFLYEPDLIPHTAELLLLDQSVDHQIQSAAIAALDSLARYRNKIQDVLTAVNAGVNHGILMALLRKTVAEVAQPTSTLPQSYVEGLLAFVSFIATHASGGNMVVGAGLVPLLIQVIENKLPNRLYVVSKTMQLLDNVLYGFNNSFQLFCNARGVETLVDRIEYEVDLDYSQPLDEKATDVILVSYGKIPVARAAVLKHLLRSMHRMMQSSGTAEGLRGLLDSSLLKSIKKILENRSVFGPSVLPIAINIMATFIHNEPTCLPVIQETGLPEAFYKIVDSGLEPVIEVIQAVPNAIGALCLNQAGQEQLTARPNIIPSLFSIFTSERHQRVLQDKENAVLIGTAIEELIRHHPSLKEPVFGALKSTMAKMEELGEAFVPPEDIKHWYELVAVSSSAPVEPSTEQSVDADVTMEPMRPVEQPLTSPAAAAEEPSTTRDDNHSRAHDNTVISYIDVFCKFLEGFFQHIPHCKDFLADPQSLEQFGRVTALPCFPYDFANSVASDSLVQVVRTMAEAATTETITFLVKLVRDSLDSNKEFWETMTEESKLLSLVNVTDTNLPEANAQLRKLTTLHLRVSLLSDIYSTAGYSHGRATSALLQSLVGPSAPGLLPDLGALHRACIWENIVLKSMLAIQGIGSGLNASSMTQEGPGLSPFGTPLLSQPEADGASASAANGVPGETSAPTPVQPSKKTDSSQERNANAAKHLASQIPSSLAPFFQAVVRLFQSRRTPDVVQKQKICETAGILAQVVLKHAELKDFKDRLSVLAYYTVMIGLTTILLVDERASQKTLHTVLLAEFYRIGGLDAVFGLTRAFMQTVDEITRIPVDERSDIAKQELVHAFGGLKVALHLLHPIVSGKALFESAQTSMLVTADKKPTEADYFEPHNFFVKVRTDSMPVLVELWHALWLVSAPLSVSKSVVQVAMEVLNTEGEEVKEAVGPSSLSNGGLSFSRMTGPDENRIRQLRDMGFPRSAAERALIRTRNNISAATELLLAHPLPFPPDPEPEPAPAAAVADVAAGPEAGPSELAAPTAPNNSDPVLAAEAEVSEAAEPVVEEPALPVKAPEEWLAQLKEAREPLLRDIGRCALKLVDEHSSLVFDVQRVFVGPSNEYRDASIRCLIDDIKAFSPSAYDEHEQPIAVRFRLLALVLNEPSSPLAQLPEDEIKPLMDALLALLLSNPPTAEGAHPTIAKWLAAHLLVTEAVLVGGDEPRAIALPSEGEPIEQQPIRLGRRYPEARTILFDFSLRLLAVPTLPKDELISALRLLVLLTQERKMAEGFVRRDGLGLLFQYMKISAGTPSAAGTQAYIAIILRHIVEDTATLNNIMRNEIKRFFSHPRNHRLIEAGMFVSGCNALALREPEVFVQSVRDLCQLSQPYSPMKSLSLKPEKSAEGESSAAQKEDKMDVDEAAPEVGQVPSESIEAVVHFLISELMKTTKAESSSMPVGEQPKPQQDDASGTKQETQLPLSETSENSNHRDDYVYSCFLMQCLTELLFSYDHCKHALLSFSQKKRNQTPAREGSTKHRTAAIQFLLSDLLSFGTINPVPSPEARKQIMICNCAMSVIVALCVDTSSSPDSKESSSELLSIRRFVMEAINRAIKDLPMTENLETRYSRLLALADLCYRLLTVRFNAGPRKANEESPTHIAKIMLEKNFVATLTNALADIDLNYPNVRGVVTAILRPLDYLSKIAMKMSRVSDKTRGVPEEASGTIDESDSEEEAEDRIETETPDLYRNSSLGMFGGEMEDVHYGADDDMEDNEGDEDEDVEMDYGEETGSEDTSATEEDVEGEMVDELEEASGESDEEGWRDEDEDEHDDLVENDEGDEEDEEGEDVEDEGEVMWQDIAVGDDVGANDAEEQDEEDDGADAVPIMHMDADEVEAASEEDEYEDGLGAIDQGPAVSDLFDLPAGFGLIADGLMNAADGHGQPMFWTGAMRSGRRRGIVDDDLEVFGRPRNVPTTNSDAVMHPLLVDPTTSGRGSTSQSRVARRLPRSFTGDPQDLLQTIEDAIGEGAAQLFQQLNVSGALGEAIRIDVPPEAWAPLHRHGRHAISASIRLERAPHHTAGRAEGRNFDPLLTVQRWLEEVKMLHGKFEQSRLSRLVNHIVLALLPDAVEVARQAKLAEEERERQRAEEAAKEAAKEKEEEEKRQAERNAQEVAQAPTDNASEQQQPAEDVDAEMVDVSTENSTENAEDGAEPVEQAAEPGSSTAAERVTVMIHGSAVDITDTGIDPTFLEALPDDMREEVLNQHVREQRAARVERPADSQISSEFLDALPPEIRAEILQQESIERARQRSEQATTQPAPAGAPAEIDPASFIASLEPQLRQVVLMDSDDVFIQSLPSHMVAEAGIHRDNARTARPHLPIHSESRPAPVQSQHGSQKMPVPRDAIQLLDKGGIAILVRLLFFPNVLKKNLLYKVMVNLCENAKTRTDLFNLLLSILQDGSGDLSAIDKSFSQMSFRSSKHAAQQTPKSAGKQRAPSDYFGSLVLPQNEVVPELIMQRCLEALTYIVSSNEVSSIFFLTEHELSLGLRRHASKKGKGKEKQVPQTHYPVVLLLGLLDRQSVLKTPSIVESVVALLATVTRPLASLKDQPKSQPKEKQGIEGGTSTLVSGTAPPTQSEPSEATTTEPDAPAPSAVQAPTETKPEARPNAEDKILLTSPPVIPHTVLRFIVNVLTAGECSGRTFSQSLSLIQHLSYIPDTRDVIASELRSRAQEFGSSLYTALDELASALQTSDVTLANSVASKFSPASSDQAKLLRVLKTIDYMYSRHGNTTTAEGNEDVEKVQGIHESFRFSPLWRRLGDCLSVIEEKPEMEHIATVLLPLIESLMVVCKYAGSKPSNAASRLLRASASPRSPSSTRESMEELFVNFTDTHRKVLNLMVRNNPSLMSGSFSLLIHNPRVLDFDNKRNYFNQQLHRRPPTREHHGTLQLNVRRQRVFEDSFQYLQRKTGDQIKYGKLSVRFYDEEGVDAGGVTREWFQILARQMFDPNYALFQPCAADRLTYQPNKASWVNPEHLSFFKFVGRVIGKAIYDGRLLDAYFARSLYRQILAKPVDYRDVEWVDPEYYNSLCWILENDPSPLELTFSVEADEFGVTKVIDLKENGRSIPVTQENRREFVQLSAQYRLYSSIKDQIESLVSGFYEVIPKDLISIFNEQELELLISGTPDIDVDEWRSATEYNGYTSSDPVIVWWWRALKSFNREERAKVLSFATGTSRVPLGGFADLQGVQGVQKFSIHRAYGDIDRLPQAHTCFNQIDLPQYSSYEMLRQQLLLAINEGGEGFGFA